MTATAVVRPLPGPGLVARSGELLLVCADGAAGVEELLGLVAEVASTAGDGSVLVRRVAAVLAADFAGRYPACAACGPTNDGRLAVLVHGSALATVVGADGEITLSAADAITSVNRLVPGPIGAVRLELPGAGAANPLARLEAGVISAAGVVFGEGLEAAGGQTGWTPPAAVQEQPPAPVAATPVPAAPAAAIPAETEPEPAEGAPADVSGAWSASSMMDRNADWPPLSLGGEPPVPFPFTMSPPEPPPAYVPDAVQIADEPLPSRDPQPSMAPYFPPPTYTDTADGDPGPQAPSLREPEAGSPFVSVPLSGADTMPGVPVPVADGRPMVLGMACVNGHLTDPSSESCLTCGSSMLGRPPVLQEGPRPPLGALLLDDGSAYVLDVDYVLGREPQQDPEVVAGTVRPLKITDSEGVVSRKHVRVALVGWEIQVVDLGSANGTIVQYPGDPQSHQLVAHQPIVVRPGTQITMGRRWFRVEALSPEMPNG